MASMPLLEKLLKPAVEAVGFELWGMEFHGGGKHGLLRIYIESESGIGADDCAKVSHQVSGVLDVEEPISGEYRLEVSSPGADRLLFQAEHFRRYSGHRVKIELRVAFDGRRKFTGLLLGLENDDVVVRIDDEEYLLPVADIDKARLVPVFE